MTYLSQVVQPRNATPVCHLSVRTSNVLKTLHCNQYHQSANQSLGWL